MPVTNPLSAEQSQQLVHAGKRVKKIHGAVRVATFNAWTFGVFAVISLLFAITSITAFVLALGLGWVAWNEFKGKTRLLQFDPTAPLFLCKNQLLLMGIIVAYAGVSIYRLLTQPIPELAELDGLVGPIEETFGSISELVISLTLLVYVAVIAATVLFQGLNALYYLARKRMMEDYLSETPGWIVSLHRRIES